MAKESNPDDEKNWKFRFLLNKAVQAHAELLTELVKISESPEEALANLYCIHLDIGTKEREFISGICNGNQERKNKGASNEEKEGEKNGQ